MVVRAIVLSITALVLLPACGRIGVEYLAADAAPDANSSGEGEPEPTLDAGNADEADLDAAQDEPGDADVAVGAGDAGVQPGNPDASEAHGADEAGALEGGVSDCRLTVGGSTVAYASGQTGTFQGTYAFSLGATGLCAAPSSCAATLGPDIVLSPCDSSPCQMWEAHEVGAMFALRNVATGACFYLTDTADGTPLSAWECASSNRELWQARCAGGDAWHLVSSFSGKALQGDEQNTSLASIVQEPEADAAQQRWAIHERATPIVVLPTSESEGQLWRYATSTPAANWNQPTFDDGVWQSGPAGFGDRERGFTLARSAWTTSDLWLRKTFQLDSLPVSLSVRVYHDEDVEVYINGVQAFTEAGWSQGYRSEAIPDAALATLQVGANSIAVHCHDTNPPRFLDVGLAIVSAP